MNKYFSILIKSYTENYKELPFQCWQSICLTCIEAIAIGMCFFISLYFVNTLHFNVAIAGTLISSYGIGTIFGGLITGKLADKISISKICIVSLTLQSISFLLLTQLQSFIFLVFNLFILGVSSYGFKTANDVWMLSHCKEDSQLRLKAINVSRAALNLGLGISGIIIGLYAANSFKNIFFIFSFILFLCVLYLISQNARQSAENHSANTVETNKNNMRIKDRKVMIMILFCLFLVGLLIAQLSATYPIYIHDAFPDLGNKAVSILYLLDTFLIILFQAPLINFLGNQNKILVAGIGAFMMGIGMLILSLSYNFILAILSCMIWTTGEMLFMPMAQLICYEKGGEKKKGQSLGNFQAIYACSAVLGPMLGGFVYYHWNGNMLWYLCGIIGILCLVTCFIFKKHA